jgi:hypothetical protein
LNGWRGPAAGQRRSRASEIAASVAGSHRSRRRSKPCSRRCGADRARRSSVLLKRKLSRLEVLFESCVVGHPSPEQPRIVPTHLGDPTRLRTDVSPGLGAKVSRPSLHAPIRLECRRGVKRIRPPSGRRDRRGGYGELACPLKHLLPPQEALSDESERVSQYSRAIACLDPESVQLGEHGIRRGGSPGHGGQELKPKGQCATRAFLRTRT